MGYGALHQPATGQTGSRLCVCRSGSGERRLGLYNHLGIGHDLRLPMALVTKRTFSDIMSLGGGGGCLEYHSVSFSKQNLDRV